MVLLWACVPRLCVGAHVDSMHHSVRGKYLARFAAVGCRAARLKLFYQLRVSLLHDIHPLLISHILLGFHGVHVHNVVDLLETVLDGPSRFLTQPQSCQVASKR